MYIHFEKSILKVYHMYKPKSLLRRRRWQTAEEMSIRFLSILNVYTNRKVYHFLYIIVAATAAAAKSCYTNRDVYTIFVYTNCYQFLS